MTTNARKWQSKCNEIQKLLEDEIYLKEDLQGKMNFMEKKAIVQCSYEYYNYNFIYLEFSSS